MVVQMQRVYLVPSVRTLSRSVSAASVDVTSDTTPAPDSAVRQRQFSSKYRPTSRDVSSPRLFNTGQEISWEGHLIIMAYFVSIYQSSPRHLIGYINSISNNTGMCSMATPSRSRSNQGHLNVLQRQGQGQGPSRSQNAKRH